MTAAFDFSNRDPKDPRGVATITPYAVPDAWLPAGENDWSTYATDPADAAKRGLTRKVSLAQVTLNNGEQYFAVQDANGKPIDLIGDRTGIDTKQQSTLTQQQTQSKAPNGQQYSRGADGTIMEWNPNSSPPGYNIPHPEMSPGAAAQTPEAKATAQAELAQKQKNAALPADQDPMWETDAERYARGQARIKQQGLDANTAADNKRADEAAAATRALQNKPSVTLTDDGKGGKVAVITTPDGKVSSVPVPGVQGTPPQVTVAGTVYERQGDGTYKPAAGLPSTKTPGQIVRGGGQNGEDVQATADPVTGAISYQPIPGAKAPNSGIGLKNVDPYAPDFNAPDLGIGAWATKQRQKIGLPPEQGGITQTDYDSAVKQAHDQASVTVTNLTSKQGVERQRYIDEQNQRQQLSSEAAGDFNNAAGIFNQVWKYADPKTGSIRNLIPGLMAEQQKYRSQHEAQATPPPALHPMFQSVSAQTAATAQPPAADNQNPTTSPSPAPYQPPATPATTSVQPAFMPPPAISAAPVAAQPPVSAPTLASPQSVVPSVPGMGVAPAPMPAPAPTVPTPSPLPPADEFGRTPASGGATATPPDYGHPSVGTTPPINMDPSQGPVGMAPSPGPVSAFAQSVTPALPPPPAVPASGQPMNPALAALPQQASARPAQYDPYSTAGRLARMGVDPSIIAQAMQQGGFIQQQGAA